MRGSATFNLLRVAGCLWTFSNTLLGLVPVALGLISGGRAQVVRGVVEAHGGLVTRLLELPERLRLGVAPMALTLGHVVLGRTQAALDLTRDHERVHVRQYERWGPFFLPAYGLSSLVAWLRGRDPYLDNRFEREAFMVAEYRPRDRRA